MMLQTNPEDIRAIYVSTIVCVTAPTGVTFLHAKNTGEHTERETGIIQRDGFD